MSVLSTLIFFIKNMFLRKRLWLFRFFRRKLHSQHFHGKLKLESKCLIKTISLSLFALRKKFYFRNEEVIQMVTWPKKEKQK
jgi:hypothetical protein